MMRKRNPYVEQTEDQRANVQFMVNAFLSGKPIDSSRFEPSRLQGKIDGEMRSEGRELLFKNVSLQQFENNCAENTYPTGSQWRVTGDVWGARKS